MGNKTIILYYFLLILVISQIQNSEQQSCSASINVGAARCVFITRYNSQYQWATCLTNDYLMRVSNGSHHCSNRTRPYCWYQCMLERYNQNNGVVTRDCQCTPSSVRPPTLSPECYSPRRDDCNWYRNCLNVLYQCQHSFNGYAIKLAEKFCKLYYSNHFNSTARVWIDGVRDCIQVKMVSYLRPWVDRSCTDIQSVAYDCYLNPSTQLSGICSLSLRDMLKVFWLVNFDSSTRSDAHVNFGSKMFFIIWRCLRQRSSNIFYTIQTRVLYLTLSLPLNKEADVVATVRYIAKTLNWAENGFRWFPLPYVRTPSGRNKLQTSNQTISMLLADAKYLDIADDICNVLS